MSTTTVITVPGWAQAYVKQYALAAFTLWQTPGSTFNLLNQAARSWVGMTTAPNGNVYACVTGGDIYMQTAGSGDFLPLSQTLRNWYGIVAAPDGDVYACVNGGDIYKQTAGTGDFNPLSQASREWMSLAAAPNGNIYACVWNSEIYMQTNGAGDFTSLALGAGREWVGMTASPNGNIYACVMNSDIYMQTAGAGDFLPLSQTGRMWQGMVATSTGDVYAGAQNGDIYKQTNGTGDFTAQGQTARHYRALAATTGGAVYAAVYGGDIYKKTGSTGAALSNYSGTIVATQPQNEVDGIAALAARGTSGDLVISKATTFVQDSINGGYLPGTKSEFVAALALVTGNSTTDFASVSSRIGKKARFVGDPDSTFLAQSLATGYPALFNARVSAAIYADNYAKERVLRDHAMAYGVEMGKHSAIDAETLRKAGLSTREYLQNSYLLNHKWTIEGQEMNVANVEIFGNVLRALTGSQQSTQRTDPKGNKAMGVVGGAISGAVIGFEIGGYYGAVIGGIVGGFAGYFGS